MLSTYSNCLNRREPTYGVVCSGIGQTCAGNRQVQRQTSADYREAVYPMPSLSSRIASLLKSVTQEYNRVARPFEDRVTKLARASAES